MKSGPFPLSPDLTPGLATDLIVRTYGQPRLHADGDLLALAYAADDTLWSVEEPGVLRQWDADGRLLGRYFLDDLETLWAFSPGATRVAAGSDDLMVWDVASHELAATLPQPSWVTALAFHPTKDLIATGHDDGGVRQWDATREKPVVVLQKHDQPVSALTFSPDGAFLASAGEDRLIRIWKTADGSAVRTLAGHTDRIPALAWQPNGRLLVSAGWDTTARVWDVNTGEPLLLLNTHADQVHALAFSPDGSLLASVDSDAAVHVWDDPLKGHAIQVLPGQADELRCLAFSRDGKRLAVGGTDRIIHVWDPRTGQRLAGHDTEVRHAIDLVAGPTGTLLLSTAGGTDLETWDADTGAERKPAGDCRGACLALACSPDGRWVVTSGAGSKVRARDLTTNTEKILEGGRAQQTTLAFSADSSTVAAGCAGDGTVWMWNVHTGDVSLLIPEAAEGCTIEAVAFHPGGRIVACGGIDWLATSGSDGAVSLWDAVERKKLGSLAGGANGLAFDPSGQTLTIGGPGEAVRLYDVASRQLVRELRGADDGVSCLAFSPDGRYLAAGGDDHTLRVWDPVTGELLAAHELDTPVKAIRFSPDGNSIYTGNGNTTCYRLDARRVLEG